MKTTIFTKIFALKLSALLNGEHFNFMKFVATAISMFQIIGERFSEGVAVFLEAFENEDEVYQKYDRKHATKLINDAGVERDEKFRILRDSIKIAQRMSDAAIVNAADILMGVIDLYGGAKIPAMRMNEKSGVLTNLVQDLEEKQVAEIEMLHLGTFLADLKTANNEFIQLVSDRTLADSEIGKSAMQDARTETDQAYRALIDSINLEVYYGRGAVLMPFNNYMNTEIDRYRILTGQGVGSSSSSSSGSTSDGEETIKFKTVTFKFANGDSIKRQVEVGTVLIAPDNTFGYVWNKEIPELMPNKNLTFKEVPIEEAKATATFHFLNHTEEKITQVVGTPLVAPPNTEGCVWEPEVPAIMPAEDTAYYEVPQNPNPENPGNGEGGENNGSNNGENNGEGGDNGTTNPDDPWYNPDDEPD